MEPKINDCKWIDAKMNAPKSHGVYMVKREDGQVTKAYYHMDCMGTLARYWKDHKLTRWQDKETGKWLYDVKEWCE